MNIGLFGAFVGGVLSLLSPCAALLLPAFFAYAFSGRIRLLARTTIFYLGLATTLVPLGATAGSLGAILNQNREILVAIAGVVMIALGLAQILGFGFGSATAQRLSGKISPSSGVSVYLLGTVYGLAGFCAGPLLGSVLTIAMTGSSPVYGAFVLATYALGMAVPLFVLALLWDRFDLGRRRWLRGRSVRLFSREVHSTTLISGAVFVVIGGLFLLTDGTANLGSVVDIDAQYAVQVAVQRVSAAVSDQTVLIAVLAVVAIGGVTWLLLDRRRSRKPEAEGVPEDATDENAGVD